MPPRKDSDQCLRDRGEDPVGARRREDEDDVGRGSKEKKGVTQQRVEESIPGSREVACRRNLCRRKCRDLRKELR